MTDIPHTTEHPLAGQTVNLGAAAGDPIRRLVMPGAEFQVIDWWDRLTEGKSWRTQKDNWACVHYGFRIDRRNVNGDAIPMDDEVVYGHIGAFGHLVHQKELE
jgi:hypothetical protein